MKNVIAHFAKFKAAFLLLPLLFLLTSCDKNNYYNIMEYHVGESVFSFIGVEILMIAVAVLFVAHIVLSIITSKKEDACPMNVPLVCKLEISRMVIFGVMGCLEVLIATNYWIVGNFFNGSTYDSYYYEGCGYGNDWVCIGGGILMGVVGLYQLFFAGKVYSTTATRESDSIMLKIMVFATLGAVLFGIIKSIIILCNLYSFTHDFIFDSVFVKFCLWVLFLTYAVLVILMIVRTKNILGALLSVVCTVPYVFGTFFCAVSGGFIFLLLYILIGTIFGFFASTLFSPSAVVLADGTQLTGVSSDLISGTPSSGRDSYGNVWDYVGNGMWSKR